jgi:NAD(P)-dependent dehydrogenase (short-subunit alcohol dehydrogenase family)
MTERVLVCGGSGGIGSATCAALAAAGFRPLVAYARARERAEQIAKDTGGLALALDLCEPQQIASALAGMLDDATEPLAGVVLAASAPLALESFAKLRAHDLELHWRVNVLGPQALLAGLLRGVFRKQRRGIVIGVLSQAMRVEAERALPMLGAYVIAKYGLEGLLAALRADHPWLSVRAVSLGFTETRLLEAFDARFLEPLRARGEVAPPQDAARSIVAALREERASS